MYKAIAEARHWLDKHNINSDGVTLSLEFKNTHDAYLADRTIRMEIQQSDLAAFAIPNFNYPIKMGGLQFGIRGGE